MEFEDPRELFKNFTPVGLVKNPIKLFFKWRKEMIDKQRARQRYLPVSEMKKIEEEEKQEELERMQEESAKGEQFEVMFNYIYLDKIQGDNKIELTKTLKDTSDLELFE